MKKNKIQAETHIYGTQAFRSFQKKYRRTWVQTRDINTYKIKEALLGIKH